MQKTVEEMISDIIDNQERIVHLLAALNIRLEKLENASPIIPVTEIHDELRAD